MLRIWFDPRPGVPQVWMNGGGTQSAAIAALICMGELPRPDYAVIMDTERERSSTWSYLNDVIEPALRKVDVVVHRPRKSDWSPVDLTCRKGKSILMPGFTNQSGRVGMLPNRCSGEWKRDAAARWLRAQGVSRCDVWYGISTDEDHRANGIIAKSPKWRRPIFPLIAKKMRRSTCVAIVRNMKWPEPPRSRCWQCPYQSDDEWRDTKENHPDDFAKAVQLQRQLSDIDPHFFLHKSCKPLEDVDFSDSSIGTLFTGCESGMCFT